MTIGPGEAVDFGGRCSVYEFTVSFTISKGDIMRSSQHSRTRHRWRSAATGAALVVGVCATVLAPTASATAVVQPAASFSSNGAVIADWYWVRDPGQTATWTFDLAPLASAKQSSIYLNVNALVTNGVNGGSGFSATGVKFIASCNNKSQVLTLSLNNPFKPRDPADSAGVGYAAYGSSSAAVNLKRFPGCTTLSVSTAAPYPAGRHVAFRQDSAVLGFSR